MSALNAADRRSGRGLGEKYFLPRAVIMARVLASPTRGLLIVLEQPEIIADNGQVWVDVDDVTLEQRAACASKPSLPQADAGPFSLSHRVSGIHKDTITISVEQSLLKSIIAETEEQTAEIGQGLAKSFGMLQSGLVSDGAELVSAHFDPTECLEVAAVEKMILDTINGEAIAELRRMRDAVGAKSPLKDLKLDQRAPTRFSLSLNGFQPFHSPPGLETTAADCRVGICYRVAVPASLLVRIDGRRRETPIMHIPNRSEPVAIPVSRSAFADIKTTLTLDQGMLTKREITRGSEVVSIVSLPATIVGSYLDELSSGFKKRKLAIDDQIALETARKERKQFETGAVSAGLLMEIPVPGLSIGGNASVAPEPVGLQNNDDDEPKGDQPAIGAKETPSSDGQAPPKQDKKKAPGAQDAQTGKSGQDGDDD